MINAQGTIAGARLKTYVLKGEQSTVSQAFWLVTVKVPAQFCNANELADCRDAAVNIRIEAVQTKAL